ncbi:MAG: DUF4382 domain-containing protein [Deltaproteobacteria bacterium]|nr:DUF4382 domain-containing protein [Deltaproteobacteria bacterium]
MDASRILRTIAVLAASLLLITCGGGGGGSGTVAGGGIGGTGRVSVVLADAPTDEYQNIWLTITEVSLIPAGDGSPVVIFQSAAGLRVDLLEYQDKDYLFSVKDVPAGQYSKIRLRVSDVEVTPKDPLNPPPCAGFEIKLPSGKIDLNPRQPFKVNAGGKVSIRLDIDANKSINLHAAGNSGKCVFRPVVFVDIREGMPGGRCPEMLSGTIGKLTYSGGQVVGFTLDLGANRGTVDVRLLQGAAIMNAAGECAAPADLKAGDEVRVKGALANDLAFEASLVAIGQLLDVIGTVTTDPALNGASFTFTFNPSPGQALVGPLTVQGQPCTLVLKGCDTGVEPASIKTGMTVQVSGKWISQSAVLRAAAIVLKDEEVVGSITSISLEADGQNLTIDRNGGLGSVDLFIPNGTPIFLAGDGVIPADLLCTGQQVKVPLDPDIPSPLTAVQVEVTPEKREGTVKIIDLGTRALTVDLNGVLTTVNVASGATLLKSTSDVQELISFEDIQVNDYVVYFGLAACDDNTTFNAFLAIVTE